MNALRLLSYQHEEIDKWFRQLQDIGTPTAPPREDLAVQAGSATLWRRVTDEGLPTAQASVPGRADSGEEIREPGNGSVRQFREDDAYRREARAAFAAVQATVAVPPASEASRTAMPPPSEANGRTADAIPGREFRDQLGHHADGKTHVGMDADQYRAQVLDAGTGRPRPESMIAQGRENLAGVMDQFGNPAMAWATGGRVGAARDLPLPQPLPDLATAEGPGQAVAPPANVARGRAHKQALANRLFEHMLAHALIEEQVLYPAARATRAAELVDEAMALHHEARRRILALRHMDVSSDAFTLHLGNLRDEVLSHVREEEGEMFPVLDRELGTPQLELLGARMQERFLAMVGIERRFAVAGVEGAIEEPPDPVEHRAVDLHAGCAHAVPGTPTGRT